MTPESLRAYGVHLLTATGAVFAMLALLSAVAGDWRAMWLWLLVAFAVDGIDGPLARRTGVTRHAARIDGALLDLIIDFLTYVFIPAFALYWAGILPGAAGLAVSALGCAAAGELAASRGAAKRRGRQSERRVIGAPWLPRIWRARSPRSTAESCGRFSA